MESSLKRAALVGGSLAFLLAWRYVVEAVLIERSALSGLLGVSLLVNAWLALAVVRCRRRSDE